MVESENNPQSVKVAKNNAATRQVLQCAGYSISCLSWGPEDAPPVICMHGLGGQGANFASLASELTRDYRVIAPDMIGRGRSQRADDPATEYSFQAYEAIILDLLDQFKINRVAWIGVSMGGALGIRMAGGVLRDRIAGLILNDIGPVLDDDILARIIAAMDAPRKFDTLAELTLYFETAFGQFGMVPPVGVSWRDIAMLGSVSDQAGGYRLHFDPAVSIQLELHRLDYDTREYFAMATCPVLVFRGEQSDVLTADTLATMRATKAGIEIVSVPDVGHTPFLDRAQDRERISQFLASHHCGGDVG
jgi:pimeloyl-ACP methyl ester carboxylesterase